MLALGIPGSPTAAVLLGGLLIWGLQPGPLLFVEQKDFVWGLIASMYLGNIVGLIVVLTTVPLFASILRIPFSIIAPVIIVICAIGAYTVHNAMLDIWFMLASASSATCSRSSTTRSRRWCWRWCSGTRPKTRSARPCWSRKAT
jgi:TctA family transporter